MIAGHNRGAAIILNLQIASHGIACDPHCRGVVTDLEITSHCVTWAHCGCSDLNGRLTVIEGEVPTNGHSAHLVLDRAGREILELEIPSDPRETTKGEAAACLNLDVAFDGRT